MRDGGEPVTVDSFLQNLTDALFVVIFLVVLARTLRSRRRSDADAALLFGAVALIVAEAWITKAFSIKPSGVLNVVVSSLLMALPYLLLRLVDDYTGVAPRLMWSAAAGLALSIATLIITHAGRLPLVITLLLVAYYVAVSAYVAARVVRGARSSSGVTRQRMRAVASGTACLALVILLVGVRMLFPHSPAGFWLGTSDVLALACGVSYFLGFASPNWLRRAWQEPDLRAFLGRAASLPRLPSTGAIVRQLEHGAASSLGARFAVIGLWNPSTEALDFAFEDGEEPPLVDAIARRAFVAQEPIFAGNATRENPDNAADYRALRVNSVLAVPIVAGEERLGVLSVYASRAPIFAEDDIKLAQLLADQAAVILESRALIDEAARVRVREEVTRLKDDFLSAAAHDLKTPLTAVIARAQLMERRASRNPSAPADMASIGKILDDAQRLRHLVTELLDVGRAEQGKLLDKREEIDLAALVRGSVERQDSPRHRWQVDAPETLVGSFDPVRMLQLVENLLENAAKYSPDGGTIEVRLWRDSDVAHLTVSDPGIGIPPADLEHLFDRFHRGTNVDDRRFAGMGLGLFITKGIAEQHGGRIWASSVGPAHGSTFHVELPIQSAVPVAAVAEPAVAPGEAI
jgi:signal transduction histidine kinase